MNAPLTSKRNAELRVVTIRTVLSVALLHSASLTRAAQSDDPVDLATAKAAAFLVGIQDPRGAISENGTHETAMTALSSLALAAIGNLPGDPTPNGASLRKAVSFLLNPDRQDAEGYFGGRDFSRMYGHGITTLTLCELLGSGADKAQDKALRNACEKAVSLILRAQAVSKRKGNEGGWRYTPAATDADLSVSIWQLMALRSAKNAGLQVPSESIDAAVDYIRNLHFQAPPLSSSPTGFRYSPTTAPVWSTCAEGLLALQVCGRYEAPEVLSTADWLLKSPPDPSKAKDIWFYYGTYYYAQGMYQRGGLHAEESFRSVNAALLPLQKPDGSWKSVSDKEKDRVYCTAMAVLSLSVKYHYLPIYQR